MIGVVLGTGWQPAARVEARYVQRLHHTYSAKTTRLLLEPIRDLHQAGCTTIILTNAAGALNPDLTVGEVVCIRDHLNLSGHSPVTTFHPMEEVYRIIGGFRTGVYAQVPGPAFETPAEARMLRTLGADMVGMSTALEAGYAHSLGITVVGLSFIANRSGTSEDHGDVLAAAAKAGLPKLLAGVIDTLHA